jgi:putative hydrolase
MRDTLNRDVATRLDEAAALLSEQGANPFRVRAYRRAAETLRALSDPVSRFSRGRGSRAWIAYPASARASRVPSAISFAWGISRCSSACGAKRIPVRRLASVPGIGPRLANRLHEEPGIDTLEDLEAAAADGRRC